MATVLITGASGLIGNRLTDLLIKKGYTVTHLSRNHTVNAPVKSYHWDIEKRTMDTMAVKQADYIIHLAGEGISNKRWSTKQKKKIIESRTLSAQLIVDAVKQTNSKLKAFITASAVGYYGARTADSIFKETDPPGNDFLATTCMAWEKSADQFTALGIRTVKIRTALVLSAKGGALTLLAKPVNYYVGSPLGTGKQFMPWIHIDDLCKIYIKAIEDEQLNGVYNAAAPEHVTNTEFTVTLAKQLHKPLFMPAVPKFLIRLLLGEMACIVLEGTRIASDKIRRTGFNFEYPTLKEAFKDIYSVSR